MADSKLKITTNEDKSVTVTNESKYSITFESLDSYHINWTIPEMTIPTDSVPYIKEAQAYLTAMDPDFPTEKHK